MKNSVYIRPNTRNAVTLHVDLNRVVTPARKRHTSACSNGSYPSAGNPCLPDRLYAVASARPVVRASSRMTRNITALATTTMLCGGILFVFMNAVVCPGRKPRFDPDCDGSRRGKHSTQWTIPTPVRINAREGMESQR